LPIPPAPRTCQFVPSVRLYAYPSVRVRLSTSLGRRGAGGWSSLQIDSHREL